MAHNLWFRGILWLDSNNGGICWNNFIWHVAIRINYLGQQQQQKFNHLHRNFPLAVHFLSILRPTLVSFIAFSHSRIQTKKEIIKKTTTTQMNRLVCICGDASFLITVNILLRDFNRFSMKLKVFIKNSFTRIDSVVCPHSIWPIMEFTHCSTRSIEEGELERERETYQKYNSTSNGIIPKSSCLFYVILNYRWITQWSYLWFCLDFGFGVFLLDQKALVKRKTSM